MDADLARHLFFARKVDCDGSHFPWEICRCPFVGSLCPRDRCLFPHSTGRCHREIAPHDSDEARYHRERRRLENAWSRVPTAEGQLEWARCRNEKENSRDLFVGSPLPTHACKSPWEGTRQPFLHRLLFRHSSLEQWPSKTLEFWLSE